jgi:Protein of unknown function (DUF1091)
LTNFITKAGPGIANSTVTILEVEDDQLVTIDVVFQKRFNLQIMVNFRLHKIEGKAIKRILQAPKFNYCDFRRQGVYVPVLTDVMKVIESFGNLIFKCPAEPGLYSIKNFSISNVPVFPFMSPGSYLMVAELLDENVISKPELISRFKVYFTRN